MYIYIYICTYMLDVNDHIHMYIYICMHYMS